MKLAAHLCGSRVNEVLSGDDAFVLTLRGLGFRRVQINATAVNGVDTSCLGESVPAFLQLVQKHPELEFILQRNDETEPLWRGVLKESGAALPSNISMLYDESKGTGVAAASWPSPPSDMSYNVGYAGGIGLHNVRDVLRSIQQVAGDQTFWIDMESSLRSIRNDQDAFDLDKCFQVIVAVCEAGLMSHPDALA
jgi:hypothetical protein